MKFGNDWDEAQERLSGPGKILFSDQNGSFTGVFAELLHTYGLHTSRAMLCFNKNASSKHFSFLWAQRWAKPEAHTSKRGGS